MKKRSSNWALWLWVIIWCGGSFTMAYSVWIGNSAGSTWGVRLFTVPFVAIGAAVLYFLVLQLVHRQRVGDATLKTSPTSAQVGDPVLLTLLTERAFDVQREVRFQLIVEREDEGWSEVASVVATTPLHAQMHVAKATLTVPWEARKTSDRFRCRAEAAVMPWKHAPFECTLNIAARDTPYAPSARTVALTPSEVDPLRAFGTPQQLPTDDAPPGAHEVAPGVWRWTERSHGLQFVGALLLVFAVFWLDRSVNVFDVREFLNGVMHVNLHLTGEMLFTLPFLVSGLIIAAIAAALLLGYARYTVRRGELLADGCALGLVFFSKRIVLSDLRVLQPIPFASTNGAATRYSVLGRATDGTQRTLAVTARSVEALRAKVGWIVRRAGVGDVNFDPVPNHDTQHSARLQHDAKADSGTHTLSGIGNALRKVMFVASALAFVGIGLIMLSAFASKQNPTTSERDASTPTPLIAAAIQRDTTTASQLITGGANVNMQQLSADKGDTASGRTALWWAAYNDDAPMVRLLMQHSADPHMASDDGWSPVSKAVQCGRLDALLAILDSCECINQPTPFPYDAWGKAPSPPLLIAISYRNATMVKRLVERGADTTTPGPWGFPVGNFAAYYGFVDVLKAMHEAGVDFRQPIAAPRPHPGQTYLMHAAHGGKREAIEYLLSTGVDPAARDADGKNAADHALAYGHLSLVQYLRSLNAPSIAQ